MPPEQRQRLRELTEGFNGLFESGSGPVQVTEADAAAVELRVLLDALIRSSSNRGSGDGAHLDFPRGAY